ncbi:MAG: SDR family NAD(P)-dependent oxidoreductase [Oscillospiraceae bacterium]|nr:SDR family NAD(P)-dependent oxidoreductase [Oscillospiraceae bacterium]
MKTIAVITGASSGMGRRFAETVNEFGPVDEIWAVARRAERLEELKKTAPFPVRAVPMDLTDPASYDRYAAMLREEDGVRVGLLVNAGGFGKFNAVMESPLETNLNMLDLNCRAVMALSQLTVPYMPEGGRIINIASVAAYQPIPYINVYAATKAFVLYYSRALDRELRSRGIRVTAVCPFWTKTEFFDRAVNAEKPPVVKKYIAMYDPDDIVARAWRDVKKGKDVSRYGFIARGQGALVKLLPHKMVMDAWQRQQELP